MDADFTTADVAAWQDDSLDRAQCSIAFLPVAARQLLLKFLGDLGTMQSAGSVNETAQVLGSWSRTDTAWVTDAIDQFFLVANNTCRTMTALRLTSLVL